MVNGLIKRIALLGGLLMVGCSQDSNELTTNKSATLDKPYSTTDSALKANEFVIDNTTIARKNYLSPLDSLNMFSTTPIDYDKSATPTSFGYYNSSGDTIIWKSFSNPK